MTPLHVEYKKPLHTGHCWDPADCLVWRGVSNSEVDLYTALSIHVVGTAGSVLIREVFLIVVLY